MPREVKNVSCFAYTCLDTNTVIFSKVTGIVTVETCWNHAWVKTCKFSSNYVGRPSHLVFSLWLFCVVFVSVLYYFTFFVSGFTDYLSIISCFHTERVVVVVVVSHFNEHSSDHNFIQSPVVNKSTHLFIQSFISNHRETNAKSYNPYIRCCSLSRALAREFCWC